MRDVRAMISMQQRVRASTRLRPSTSRSQSRIVAPSASHFDDDLVCAVSEARGISPTIGVAFINVSTTEAVMCQFTDTQTFAKICHKIKAFDPSRIIYAKTATSSKLISVLTENLAAKQNNISMTGLDRKYWSENKGFEYIQQLAFAEDLESLMISAAGSYFAVCCFAAALEYLDFNCGVTFVAYALRIRFEPSEGAMMIDLSTIASLELVQNLCDIKSQDCLFGVMDETQTRMGRRILKSNILQPSTDVNKILRRSQAVAELTQNGGCFTAVRQALRDFVDTDRVLAALVLITHRVDFNHMEQSANHVLMLKGFVSMILPVWQALAGVSSEELQRVRELCETSNYMNVQGLLDSTLNEHVHYAHRPVELRNQRVWAVKAGTNGFLDVARQTYTEIDNEIKQSVQELQEQYSFRLDLKYDPARQYYIKAMANEINTEELPRIFINVHRSKTAIEFQTLELVKLNQKLKDTHNEIVIISDASIQTLIGKVHAQLHPLFKISESIALLDMLSTFAHVAITYNYVQPEILATLAIKSGRHPVQERIQQEDFVPNDVYASHQTRFQIITGCNMSGKSTYLRSVAVLTIMAQVGSFVPAEYASFPIIHQLFARVSTDDNINANVSTFAAEMREVAFILHNIEPRGLVIVDELGRGTSTTDGLAIAIAISEALIESGALVFFVTHFRDLPHILAERAGVVNLHLTVSMDNDFSCMKMMYKISDGWETQRLYGVALAKFAGLPQQLIDDAREISAKLYACHEAHKQSCGVLATAKKRKLVLKLREQLSQAGEMETIDQNAQRWLKILQEEFIVRMHGINAEMASVAQPTTVGSDAPGSTANEASEDSKTYENSADDV